MSDRAREFLIDWFSAHVHPLPVVRRLAEAVRLATKCRADATASGIPMQEIRDVADGDLILRLIQALDAAARLDEDAPIAPDIRTLNETETSHRLVIVREAGGGELKRIFCTRVSSLLIREPRKKSKRVGASRTRSGARSNGWRIIRSGKSASAWRRSRRCSRIILSAAAFGRARGREGSAVFSEPELLLTMSDVGYIPPNTLPV